MLTKEQFVRSLERLKELDDQLNKKLDVLSSVGVDIGDCCGFELISAYVQLLEYAMEIPDNRYYRQYGSDIDWWVYETAYGRRDLHIERADGSRVETATAEELYDYIVEEVVHNDAGE